MTREPFIAHSELTNEIYIVQGQNKYRVTEQVIHAVKAIKALEQEPKIKVLDSDEVARKLGTVDIYKANAWITLLKDLEYLGMKICEVEE